MQVFEIESGITTTVICYTHIPQTMDNAEKEIQAGGAEDRKEIDS